MPLKPFHILPESLRDWAEWCRNTTVEPGEETVTEPMLVDNAASNRVLRDSVAYSVIGNPTASSANPADIAAGSDNVMLFRRSGALQFTTLVDADIPATIARDGEVAAAVAAHEALPNPHPDYVTTAELANAEAAHEAEADPHPVYPLAAGAETIAGAWSFSLPVQLPAFPVGSLPSAVGYVGALVYIGNEAGGAVVAFSDGTDWRRVTDRAVVS
jgi:hypothetical protein